MQSSYEKNPKSLLLEFFQKRDGSPTFYTSSVTQAPQNPCFKCKLVCPPVSCRSGNRRGIPEMTFEGSFRTKKRAEQEAATTALEFYASHGLIATFTRPSTSSTSESVPSPPPTQTTVPSVVMGPASVAPGSTYGGNVYVTHPQQTELVTGMTPMNGYQQHLSQEQTYAVNSIELSQPNGIQRLQYNVQQPDDVLANDYVLDNDDLAQKEAEIKQCSTVRGLRKLALECLDDMITLRKELFRVTEDLRQNAESAKTIIEVARLIEANRREYDTQ
eukprot:g1301.t1